MTVCSYHVTYTFQSEPTLYICLNVKEILARNRRNIWSLSDWNGTRTYNHLVPKRILNHLAKLAKWLSCVVSTYLYGAFDSHLSPAVLEEMVLSWEATPASLHPAGCLAGHTGKWEYEFSILEGANKELWAARVGHNTRINY